MLEEKSIKTRQPAVESKAYVGTIWDDLLVLKSSQSYQSSRVDFRYEKIVIFIVLIFVRSFTVLETNENIFTNNTNVLNV
jgi:hypothetical protein